MPKQVTPTPQIERRGTKKPSLCVECGDTYWIEDGVPHALCSATHGISRRNMSDELKRELSGVADTDRRCDAPTPQPETGGARDEDALALAKGVLVTFANQLDGGTQLKLIYDAIVQHAAAKGAERDAEIKRLRDAYDWFTQEIRKAIHGENWGFGRDHVQYVADVQKLKDRAKDAELSLSKMRGLLRRVYDKLQIILPKVDDIISLQAIRSGNPRYYDGPNLSGELAEIRAALESPSGGEKKAEEQP